MKKTSFLLLILAVQVCLSCSASNNKKGSQTDDFKIEKTVCDLGTVYTDSAKRSFVLNIENTGDTVIIVRNIRTDCSCTKAEMSGKVIRPHGKAYLNVNIDLGEFVPSPVTKKIGIYIMNRKEPVIIDIKGLLQHRR